MKYISKCAFHSNAINIVATGYAKKTWPIIYFLLLLVMGGKIHAQAMYGTTGLLHAPTAEMQKDKTILIGGSMIDQNIYRSGYWNSHKEYNPYTYNYYLNITFFPWLEVAYTCTLVKGVPGWPQQTLGKFVNQDRSFHFRLRAWKEGWWKLWTPQIVLGANDPGSHSDHGGGNITFDNDHGFTLGANFRFNRQGDGFWTKALNGLNLMGEYYDGVVNVGGNYAVWKDRINLTASLYDGKYWSVGLYFRVCLK